MKTPTLDLSMFSDGMRIVIDNPYILGPTKFQARLLLKQAETRNIVIVVESSGAVRGPITGSNCAATRTEFLKPLPSGRTANVASPLVSRTDQFVTYVLDENADELIRQGSYHTCICDRPVGRPRALSKQEELNVIDRVLTTKHLRTVASEFNISTHLIKMTMTRYGYVRLDETSTVAA